MVSSTADTSSYASRLGVQTAYLLTNVEELCVRARCARVLLAWQSRHCICGLMPDCAHVYHVICAELLLRRDIFVFTAVVSASMPNSHIKKNGIHNADYTFPYNVGAHPEPNQACLQQNRGMKASALARMLIRYGVWVMQH